MNPLDKIIGFVSPEWGLKRVQSRAAMDIVKRSYDASRQTKRDKGSRIVEDPESEVYERLTLRKKSRTLFQNNPFAKSAHRSIKNNTIGTGILPAIADDATKKVWQEWADSVKVDFDENLNFYGIQALAVSTMTVHGDAFVLRVKSRERKRVPLELKVLPPRFLDTTKDTLPTTAGGYVKGGIEFLSSGKKKGYWFYDREPTEALAKSYFWPKDDVIHLFEVDEGGQMVGVPTGVQAMGAMRDFDDYATAQLVRQKIAACFSVFITDADAQGTNIGGDDGDKNIEKVEPGIIEYLAPGKQVTFASPPPAEGFSDYSKTVLTGIASAHGLTYEAMTGDLSNVNFSSLRGGTIEYMRNIESIQWFVIIPKLCAGVYDWFVNAAILAGMLKSETSTVTEWTPPRRQMVDPVKEANGMIMLIRAGLISWQEGVRLLGYEPGEILKELQKSKELFDKAGIMPKSDPRFDSANILAKSDKNDTNNS